MPQFINNTSYFNINYCFIIITIITQYVGFTCKIPLVPGLVRLAIVSAETLNRVLHLLELKDLSHFTSA